MRQFLIEREEVKRKGENVESESLSIPSLSLHFLSISSFSLLFFFIFSFSLHFLTARLAGWHNLCSPAAIYSEASFWKSIEDDQMSSKITLKAVQRSTLSGIFGTPCMSNQILGQKYILLCFSLFTHSCIGWIIFFHIFQYTQKLGFRAPKMIIFTQRIERLEDAIFLACSL